MRDAYNRMKELGVTDVTTFNSYGLTKTAIPIADLLELLNFRGMLRRTDSAETGEKWKGSLPVLKMYLIGEGYTQLVDAYELWFSHVTNIRQSRWDTTLPKWAQAFKYIADNFGGMIGFPTMEDFEEVAKLGGGWLKITQSEYDQYVAEDASAAAQSQWDSVRDSRITNAVALFRERATPNMDASELGGVWSSAWADAGV